MIAICHAMPSNVSIYLLRTRTVKRIGMPWNALELLDALLVDEAIHICLHLKRAD